jgi:3-oxoacyl-[acyl-carrier protein] reductase
MDLGIKGKVALVTGGSKGIGREISVELAREGCRVAVVARNQDAIDATVAEIKAAGGTAIGISADLSVLDNYDRAVEETTRAFGAPDIAIFNMETPAPGQFEKLTEEDFAYAYHVVVLCYLRMVRLVLPHMRAQKWGRIVTIGSAAAKQPVRAGMGFDYHLANTTRISALALSKTVAADVISEGITVNTVGTGYIETENAKIWLSTRAEETGVTRAQFFKNFMTFIPAGRPGTVQEMSGVCLFLCSDRASYTTGEIIMCDGAIVNSLS